jgi:hypothetical protein
LKVSDTDADGSRSGSIDSLSQEQNAIAKMTERIMIFFIVCIKKGDDLLTHRPEDIDILF